MRKRLRPHEVERLEQLRTRMVALHAVSDELMWEAACILGGDDQDSCDKAMGYICEVESGDETIAGVMRRLGIAGAPTP